MKKLLLSAVILLSACRSAPAEEKFVNPLFYKTLEPISRMAWTTYLSPTQIRTTNEGYEEIEDCITLENTFEKVSLKCTRLDDDKKENITNQYTYIIKNCIGNRRFYGGRWCVEEKITDSENNELSWALFIIN